MLWVSRDFAVGLALLLMLTHRRSHRQMTLRLAETRQRLAGLFIHVEPSIELDHDSPNTGLPPTRCYAVPSGLAANAFIPVIEL